MTNPRFCVQDIETLGYEPTDALIEIGWVTVQRWEGPTPPPSRGHWDDRRRYHIGEDAGSLLFGTGGQVMCPSNRAVHHIDPAELEPHPPFDYERWAYRRTPQIDYNVAHNAQFERQWLDGGEIPWICTYKCAIWAWPDAPSHSNQALKYYLGMPDSPILYPPHRAYPDALVTAYILTRLLDEYSVEQLVEWTEQPRRITKMTFGKHSGEKLTDLPWSYLEWIVGPRFDGDEDVKYACRKEMDRRRASENNS